MIWLKDNSPSIITSLGNEGENFFDELWIYIKNMFNSVVCGKDTFDGLEKSLVAKISVAISTFLELPLFIVTPIVGDFNKHSCEKRS